MANKMDSKDFKKLNLLLMCAEAQIRKMADLPPSPAKLNKLHYFNGIVVKCKQQLKQAQVVY